MLCITERFMGYHVIQDFIFDYVFHHFTSDRCEVDESMICWVGLLLPVLWI